MHKYANFRCILAAKEYWRRKLEDRFGSKWRGPFDTVRNQFLALTEPGSMSSPSWGYVYTLELRYWCMIYTERFENRPPEALIQDKMDELKVAFEERKKELSGAET